MNSTDARKRAKPRAHFAWQEMVAARTDLRPIFKSVAWALALFPFIDPSYSKLAEWAGVSERTAKRAIAEMERLGLIEVTRTPGYAHDERNQYYLLMPEGLVSSQTLGVSSQTPDNGVSSRVKWGVHCGTEDPNSTKGRERAAAARAVARRQEKGKGQNNGVPANAPAAKSNGAAWPALREIWQRPHVENQEADHAAFVKACGEVLPEVILDGAHVWVAAYADEPNFLPPLWKWLGDRGWKKKPKRGRQEKSAAAYAYESAYYSDGTPRDDGDMS
jgi:Helix-turn-helix domain